MLAQVESENVWGWFEHAAEDVGDAVVDAANTTLDVVEHPQKYTEMAVEAIEGNMLAQAEAESFWDSVGDWFEGASKTVASGVTGATVALGTEKFWNDVGNGMLQGIEADAEQIAVMGAETPI